MPTQPHYPNAPITEAIIDLRVELSEDAAVSDLEKVQRGLESAYPTKRNRMLHKVEGEIGNERFTAETHSRHLGYSFTSRDQKQVFQARLDGFTMSRLAPYERWEPFRDEARRLWKKYRSIAKPTSVTRLAVRFINRLDLPLPVADLKEYLKTAPEISSDLPQDLAGYFMQLRIPLEDISSFLVVNQAIIKPDRPGVVSVVLDNDIYRVDELPTDEQGVWDFFEVLHERKNEVFEASITDKARELFK